MEAKQLFELMQKVDNSKDETFTLNIETFGTIELRRHIVINILFELYSDARRIEFRKEFALLPIKAYQIADIMGLSTVTYSQMLSGVLKSTGDIKNTIEFIQRSKAAIDQLC